MNEMEMTFTLHNPLTEEEWDLIEDVDFDHTTSITFRTKHGKEVKFVKRKDEIVRCKDCEYGEQDEVGRWFCRSLGCQIGNEDGSGYCADAERRTNG